MQSSAKGENKWTGATPSLLSLADEAEFTEDSLPD